jgi:hypothetical protein
MDHQAFAQLLGNYGEFIGAIAVVVTLFYLAVQVRQSKEATEANTRSIDANRKSAEAAVMQSYFNAVATIMSYPVQNAELARLIPEVCSDPRELSEDNWLQAGLFFQLNFRHFQNTFLLHDKGLLDDDVFDAEMGQARTNLELPGIGQWWQAAGRNQFAPRFVAYLEELELAENMNFYWLPGEGFVSSEHWLRSSAQSV